MKHLKFLLSISLVFVTICLKAQNDTFKLSMRQIYDFEVGDVFITKIKYPGAVHFDCRWVKRHIIERQEKGPNSIVYKYIDSVWQGEAVYWDFVITFKGVETKSQQYNNLDKIISYPGDSTFITDQGHNFLSSYYEPCSYHKEGIVFTKIIFPVNPEGFDSKTFIKGAGDYLYVWRLLGDLRYHSAPLYYKKKNGVEWGKKPIINVGTEEISKNNLIKVRPNPASDQIFLSQDFKDNLVYVYNTEGKLVISTKNKEYLNIKSLKTGLHYLVVIKDDKIYRGKFIKK